MVIVSIADLKVTGDGNETLVTYALGSCVGICLRDAANGVYGLAHIMLPWSKEASSAEKNPRRYADTCITELISTMVNMGAKRSGLEAKIAGGAQMFGAASGAFNIGERNISAVYRVLEAYGIPAVGAEVGGSIARTLYFHCSDFAVEIRTANRPNIII